MNTRLHTYFDRTMVGHRDFFRQLIFLTFAPISILLFGLHLAGSYGLTISPALACSACFVVVSAVSLIFYIVKGPQKLRYIMSTYLILLMIIQSVRLLILATVGGNTPPKNAHNAQHNCLLCHCACSQYFLLAQRFACLYMH